ncbi:hypothetical protein [Oleomonas cavernae]|uniref:hypothetical protein n=1 Tax=Oleomonas cavernae TaxID=2320859 RepID=UPI0011C3A9C4|nr:hypothetical protein [Oleomonas cavernae]
MPGKIGRSSEHDISVAVLRYLSTLPKGESTTGVIKQSVPEFINLTAGDHEPSETRPNEEMWVQVVGNIVSHRKDSPENFVNLGLLSYRKGHLAITDAGRAYLKRKGF